MPSYTSVAAALDKSKLASSVVYLTLLEVDVVHPYTRTVVETLYFVHNNEPYTFRGHTYEALPFEFNVSRARDELPKISISINDRTQLLQGRLQEYAGGVDWPVRLMVVSTVNSGSPEIEERFTIQSASSSEYAVSFELSAENPLSMRFPTRLMFRNRCMWKYKGSECKYAGGLTGCDYTLNGANGCNVHGNSRNFGGFPGIRNIG